MNIEFAQLAELIRNPEGLQMLNNALTELIPFNKPHGFEVTKLAANHIEVKLPHQKANFNHLQGLHAGALMTLSEFTTGCLLLARMNPAKYRIILKKVEVDYFYQGKSDAFGTFEISEEWFEQNLIQPLQTEDAVVVKCEVKTHDKEGNLLCSANVFWQFKSWEKVKTK